MHFCITGLFKRLVDFLAEKWEHYRMATPLKSLLPDSISRAGIAREVTAAMVCNEFDAILNEMLQGKAKGKARALYLKNATLTVAVLSSALGQEIKLRETEILEQLRKKAGQNQIERIRFLV